MSPVEGSLLTAVAVLDERDLMVFREDGGVGSISLVLAPSVDQVVIRYFTVVKKKNKGRIVLVAAFIKLSDRLKRFQPKSVSAAFLSCIAYQNHHASRAPICQDVFHDAIQSHNFRRSCGICRRHINLSIYMVSLVLQNLHFQGFDIQQLLCLMYKVTLISVNR